MATVGYICPWLAIEATDDYRDPPLATEDSLFPDVGNHLCSHSICCSNTTCSPSSGPRTKTKVGALTPSQLRSQSGSTTFQLVSLITLLQFDQRSQASENLESGSRSESTSPQFSDPYIGPAGADSNESEDEEEPNDILADTDTHADEFLRTRMLESHAQVHDEQPDLDDEEFDSSPLDKLLDSPKEVQECYTRIKKDIFHAVHMSPLSSNGLRAVFLRSLRDHMMRWDLDIRAAFKCLHNGKNRASSLEGFPKRGRGGLEEASTVTNPQLSRV
ncbi:hypothetical protein K438DRAFT_1775490 [Mycena galopus ATCC 62051]|nr:hypothetical protein K438DRAFT_1775490 [Mycena galopus ATCC 62051]